MAVEINGTREALSALAQALRATLERVGEHDLTAPVAAQRAQVIEWLGQLDAPARGVDGLSVDHPPPFPLTGAQWRALEEEVDRVAQQRMSERLGQGAGERIASANEPRSESAGHKELGASHDLALLSSYMLAGTLVVSLALNAANIAFFRSSHEWLFIVLNLVVSGGALLMWYRHHRHLIWHGEWLQRLHPRLALRGAAHVAHVMHTILI